MLVAVMAIALAAPLAATASPGRGKTPAPVKPATPVAQPSQNNEPAPPTGRAVANIPGGKTWVDKSLLNDATRDPRYKIDVIVRELGWLGAAQLAQWPGLPSSRARTPVSTSRRR